MALPQITSPPQAQAEVVVNHVFSALEHQAVYGQRQSAHSGLTWGYFGGPRWGGFAVSDGTLSLTNAATNYLTVERASGTIGVSTSSTNWDNTDDYARVYKLTTAGSVVTAQEDHRAGPNGVHGGGAGGSSGLTPYAPLLVQSQALQARTYLMRDGSWRNPNLIGIGSFTVGTGFTITDDTKYNSWPGAMRGQSDDLAIVYTKGDDHTIDATSKAVVRIATDPLTGNPSFASEVTAYDHASIGVSQRGISKSSTGRWFVTIIRTDTGAITGKAGIVYSDDRGSTWSAFVDCTTASGFDQECYAAGPVVELPDGRLMYPVEGTMVADTPGNRWSKVIFSSDDGLTWSGPITVANYSTGSRIYVETVIGVLDDHSLLAIHRCSAASGTHYSNRSTDGGATWSTPVSAFSGFGAPGWCQLSSGTLVATTRDNSGSGCIAYSSVDRGVTWSALISIDATMTESEYAFPLEDRYGRPLVFYGTQPSGATTNADIKAKPLTEVVHNMLTKDRVYVLTDGATITPDLSLGDNLRVTLGGNRTLANPTNPRSGQVINLRVIQDGTGSRTLAYGAKFKFPAATAPVLSTAAGSKDLLSFEYDHVDDSYFLVASKAFA